MVAGFQVVEPYAAYTRRDGSRGDAGHATSSPPMRGRGLGRRMSDETLAARARPGFRKIVVGVRADNPGAQAFYAGLGFQPCGRLARQVFVDGRIRGRAAL